MSYAETKAELERWQPPRHDFWLAIAVKRFKWPPSPTGQVWRAEVDCARTFVAGSYRRPYERKAVMERILTFQKRFEGRFLVAGFTQADEGLWFAFYRFERPVGL